MKTKALTVTNKRVASSVKASMDFEGLRLSANAQKIGERYLEGEISSQDARANIMICWCGLKRIPAAENLTQSIFILMK